MINFYNIIYKYFFVYFVGSIFIIDNYYSFKRSCNSKDKIITICIYPKESIVLY